MDRILVFIPRQECSKRLALFGIHEEGDVAVSRSSDKSRGLCDTEDLIVFRRPLVATPDRRAPHRSDGASRSRGAVSHAVKVQRDARCSVCLVARRNHRAGKHDPDHDESTHSRIEWLRPLLIARRHHEPTPPAWKKFISTLMHQKLFEPELPSC